MNKTTEKQNLEAFPSTVKGFVAALERIELCRDIYWDEFAETPVIKDRATGKTMPVTDDFRAAVKGEVEARFGIYNCGKFDDAFRVFYSSPERRIHPIKERIESIEYDGGEHIAGSLVRILNVKPSPYAIEAARLMFAGGIQRLY